MDVGNVGAYLGFAVTVSIERMWKLISQPS